MKKINLLVLFIVLFVLLLSIAVAAYAINISHKKELSWSENPWDSFAETVDEFHSNVNDEKKRLDIPVYSEAELLFETNGLFYLGRDSGFYHGTNAMQNEAGAILATYPTSAIRFKNNGAVYTIHETDSGYRLFLFFDKSNNYSIPMGFPIVIKSVLSFSDFSCLDIGDPIELVEKIDPVATLHKRVITDVWELEVKGATYFAEHGYPCASIHYLTDGLLRIEYDMLDNGKLVISRIDLNENCILTDVLGNEIDCTIYEIDLPNR
jgi:hypothetical protein